MDIQAVGARRQNPEPSARDRGFAPTGGICEVTIASGRVREFQLNGKVVGKMNPLSLVGASKGAPFGFVLYLYDSFSFDRIQGRLR